MPIWFQNTFLVEQAYKLEKTLLAQIWREMSKTHSSMYHLETTYFIQIWREMSIWFENTKFYVSPRDYIFHPNFTWNVDLVRKHIFSRASL